MRMTFKLKKVQTNNLWDQAYSTLKENIIKRNFKPNQKLAIPELVEQLGISNTPLRDTIIRLEMEGLVKTVPKVGTFVTPITEEDVKYTWNTRLMLELWVADTIVAKPASTRNYERLEYVIQNALHSIETSDVKDYIEEDFNFRFHMEYMKLGDNPRNEQIYSNLMNYRFILIGTFIETYEICRTAVDEHRLILHALKEGDKDDIHRTLTLHLNTSRDKLLSLIRKQGGAI